MTDVVAQDDTVTFEENHASFSAFYLCLRLTSPNYKFTVSEKSSYTSVT